ncbi:50S ribosomal protein L15 [Caldinitratiruptor microaerophilus]|uniref:Large ribosomal subunit protein uL15 n=1 Tax=Caldinitratiruptor microaerophilus TaxID=671077 RepID=A0AA35GBE2_9FIRM|nr:50S ribosomal protein L15 [Caldinitratiruptor microaerophilus]BDG62239.1 50S ribosomal protein L15 [Caldinitratiruptor microaerophilus]
MQLHDLRPAPGSKHPRKRVGRGIGSGHGKTATRGTKGQWARTGTSIRPGFEGGQMPLQRRTPKRGFTNAPFRKEYEVVNLSALERFEDGTVVTPELLRQARLVHGDRPVKILGRGDLARKLTVQAHAFSQSAMEKIAAAGGKAEILGQPGDDRPADEVK